MIPVTIDISGAIDRLILTEEEVKSYSRFVLDNISNRYMQLWEKGVDTGLNSTRGAYKSGMSMRYVDDFNVEFTLDGKGVAKLGLMIEQGTSAYDLKEGFKRSDKVKTGKNGWYLTIPFRHATSQALAESGAFANKLPRPVEQISKKSARPLKLSDLPKEFQVKGKREEITQSGMIINEYQHKHSIFEGLTHSTKQHHGQYHTFRRVGEASDPLSWIHKGFDEHNFMGKALDKLTSELEPIIDLAEEQFLSERYD